MIPFIELITATKGKRAFQVILLTQSQNDLDDKPAVDSLVDAYLLDNLISPSNNTEEPAAITIIEQFDFPHKSYRLT